MNITYDKKDELNAVLTVSLGKEDYETKVDEQLKNYRKKANIPGFRPGTAPIGMLKKLYGKPVLAEEINKLATENLYNYLKENKIDILGQPLLIDEKSEINIETTEDFKFAFDLGLAPDFDFNISDKDVVKKYVIEIAEKDIEDEINNLCKRYGILEKVEISEAETDSILISLTELDADHKPVDGGVSNKETTVIPELVKDDEIRKLFAGVKTGDKIIVNLKKMLNNNEAIISSVTGLPKEGVNDLNSEFEAEIKNIQKFSPSEINQELFDKVYGEGVVTDENTFRTKVKENVETYYKYESENHFEHEIEHLIMEKHSFELPDEFLKKWLSSAHPNVYTPENTEKKYEVESNGLRYQLIQEKAINLFSIEVSDEEINQTALGYSANLLRNYGIPNPDFEWVKEFAEKQKKDKRFMDKVGEIAFQRAVINHLKNIVTIEEEKTTVEGFYEIIKQHNHHHNH
ncbi:MAG: trigger factor [Bacteroidetes bacterium]|nr:trigger factor [Bacteroidota bacterium]